VANYHQVKNAAILTPATNTDLGSASNKYGNLYLSGNLTLGSTVVNASNAINPKVNSITYPGTETATDTAGGEVITLNGTGFQNPCAVLIGSISAGTVTFISSTQITFVAPAMSANTYVLYLINSDGGTAIVVPGISYSGTPTWSTSAGSLGSVYETAAISNTLTATGDAPITYTVASGTLPTGSTLNNNGTLSGTAQVTASSTTYNFTIAAKDAQNQTTNRSFSLTINPDAVTWSSPASNATYNVYKNQAISNVTMSATSGAGGSVTYTADTLPSGLSISGANITGTPTVAASTTTVLTATASTTRTATRTINWVVQLLIGKLWGWGFQEEWFNGASFQPLNLLSDGTSVDKSSPVQTTTGGSNWKQVTIGGDSVAAIKNDGTLWTWGNNSYGQLGNNLGSGRNRYSVPQQITGTTWSQVSAKYYNMAAVKTDGTLWTWGLANKGQLGNNTAGPNKSSPVQVGTGTTWSYVSSGYNMAGIKTDGTLWCWGSNYLGQQGNGGVADVSNPAQLGSDTWITAYTTGYSTYGIKTNGTLWAWGQNNLGQLADNTIVRKSSPVQIYGGGTNWQSLAIPGSPNAMAAIKTDGTLWCWGSNYDGILGTNDITDRSSPTQIYGGGTTWKQVSIGNSAIAIKTDGSIWTWGSNGKGQLGNNNTTPRSSPAQVTYGGSNWISVAAGSRLMFAIGN